LATSDGVQLRATYIRGTARKGSDEAKQTTPVVMLHDFKSTRAVFMPLVAQLTAPAAEGAAGPSFAAILVDMRAHGESTKQVSPEGGVAELDAAKLSKEGLYAMAGLDMEAVRNFLVEKNDEGELNLNKLCIIGSGLGAGVAANWALQDWSAPPLAVGKQGQDVKAIVMVSPRWSYNGLMIADPMKSLLLKKSVAWLLIYGAQDQKLKSDFSRIEKQIERAHPEAKKAGTRGTPGFEVNALPSSLQGDSLITKSADVIDPQIVKFLTENVATLKLPWTNRTKKLP
jgi:pimeloyl-ACP methyl ester carboxylesterase